MKKDKPSNLKKMLKSIGYIRITITVLVVFVLYSQTTESKSFNGYDYAILIGGIFLFYLGSEVDDLKNQVEELESRLDDIQNGEDPFYDEY